MADQGKASDEADYFALLFEGSPGPAENPGLIDVVNSKGESIPPGEWVKVENPKYPEWDLWEMRFYIRKENGKTILEPPKSQELLVSMEPAHEDAEGDKGSTAATLAPTYSPRLRKPIN
ncbi:hypothetical protein ACFPL7_13345 [Dongia soli]|uniref:Uncharacterized protein n=1 Tax=Dongia soli TaxID=600628 RepID=A0ABU5ECJ9_9PROT|nr:hypothetical protein [Dongia soli]MDY0884113.1 hypothetical protein [Dongia soli]